MTIDGERWDSPQGGSRLVVQLAPGAHRVEVKKDGFRTYTSTVQIHRESQTVNVTLPPGHTEVLEDCQPDSRSAIADRDSV